MSDATQTVVGDAICVLVVGDSQPADEAMSALAARLEGVSLLRERTLEGARDRLADRDVHCLVCPFDVGDGGTSEPTFERLAAGADERPIIALTDDEYASRALEAGASDVVDPDDSPDLLTARIRNAAERERYRLAAEKSDQRYRSILEHAAAVVWVLDPTGEIEYASPAVESRMGYTPTELERTGISRLVHPDDRAAARDTLAAVAAAPVGTSERVSLRLGHADGTWHVAELTVVNRLEDPTVDGIVVTRTDAGAPTGAAADDAARTGIDRLTDPFFTLGPQGEIRYANRAARRVFAAVSGREADDEIPTGTIVWELLPDDIGATVADRIREAETTESVVEFELPVPPLETRLDVAVYPGDDGVSVYAKERSPATGTSATAADRDRLALLESVVDGLDDGIAVLEGSTVELANRTLLELAETDALVGRPLEELFDDALAETVRERAESPVVRWMDPCTGELAIDASRSRPVDVFVAPLPDPDRTLCIVRDRRGSRGAALSTIQRTATALRNADTPTAVRESVTGAIREYVGADAAIWYRVDDRLRPAAVTTAAQVSDSEQPGIEPPSLRPDAIPLADLLDSAEPSVRDRPDFDDALERIGLRAERVLAVPIADRGIVLATSTEPMAFDGVDTGPLETLSATAVVALERLEYADGLRTCRHDRDRLQTTVAEVERVWDAAESMVDADTREVVERQLCEAIVSLPPLESADGIELAWVGRLDSARETVVPETWAGRDGAFLEETPLSLDSSAASPTVTAAATRESVLCEDLETGGAGRGDDGEGDRWRRHLLERGFQSVLSLPLESGEFCYGTCTAYASDSAAFDDTTRRACEHLATIAGAVIGAIETKRALLADRITELEVVVRDDSDALSSIAHRIDRRIDVQAVIPRSSGGSTVFCSVDDADSDAIRDAIESLPAVDRISVAEGGNGETVLEIGLTEAADPHIARSVAENGGVLRSLTPVDDRTRLAIELGQSVGVRPFLRALEQSHPDPELVARRERDRSPRSVRPFDTLVEHLSERQRRTLEAAYYSGFFDWPREHTGEEVAESLGISQPTFSRHLRIAQRKLFALLFDESRDE
ncbi:bacterio-opsin activator domain-containing protein [Natrinema salsiterrestre]|uniref:Helix-turn-helix domain-containing protein n=1 Tax=Natrinema salsiterrestre TaxID=2950540 RepID=A0A9Q4KY43_9EURY|nr:bacterio-opsin activator domain-containing protein [Natrinema salsiterrestre]MDF9745945.1 helix-turn-helix domain-containing protein [Natrinema salsiterrestre]